MTSGGQTEHMLRPHSDPQLIPPVHQSTTSHQTHSTLNSDFQSPESKTYLQTGSICSHLHSWDSTGWNVNTLANTTYKLKKKHRWFVKLQVKKETQKAGVVSCCTSRGVWFLSQNLHLKRLRHNTDPCQYISPTPGNLCTVNTCKDE